MKIVVTRTEPGAAATAARLWALGHEPVMAPMLSVTPTNAAIDLGGVGAVLFTSANGVRAFADRSPERAVDALCVGPMTADAARDAGFTSILSGGGDGQALAELASLVLRPEAGKLLHAAGEDLAGDLATALRDQGFTVETTALYRAEQASSMSSDILADVAKADAVLFHSARAISPFQILAAPHTRRLRALCLSPRVAAAASPGAWREVLTASEPDEALLLALI